MHWFDLYSSHTQISFGCLLLLTNYGTNRGNWEHWPDTGHISFCFGSEKRRKESFWTQYDDSNAVPTGCVWGQLYFILFFIVLLTFFVCNSVCNVYVEHWVSLVVAAIRAYLHRWASGGLLLYHGLTVVAFDHTNTYAGAMSDFVPHEGRALWALSYPAITLGALWWRCLAPFSRITVK